jgi:chemotaxis receptor (MCP) glutamine deamidase CheD
MAKQSIASTEIRVAPDTCRVAREGDRLVAHHILSDVVVAIHIPAAGFAAMLRFTAPDSSADPDRALQSPWSFADTGIPLFLATIGSLACRHSTVYTVGAASLHYGDRALSLGAQNRLATPHSVARGRVAARRRSGRQSFPIAVVRRRHWKNHRAHGCAGSRRAVRNQRP